MTPEQMVVFLRAPGHNCCDSIREAAALIERLIESKLTDEEYIKFISPYVASAE